MKLCVYVKNVITVLVAIWKVVWNYEFRQYRMIWRLDSFERISWTQRFQINILQRSNVFAFCWILFDICMIDVVWNSRCHSLPFQRFIYFTEFKRNIVLELLPLRPQRSRFCAWTIGIVRLLLAPWWWRGLLSYKILETIFSRAVLFIRSLPTRVGHDSFLGLAVSTVCLFWISTPHFSIWTLTRMSRRSSCG